MYFISINLRYFEFDFMFSFVKISPPRLLRQPKYIINGMVTQWTATFLNQGNRCLTMLHGPGSIRLTNSGNRNFKNFEILFLSKKTSKIVRFISLFLEKILSSVYKFEI